MGVVVITGVIIGLALGPDICGCYGHAAAFTFLNPVAHTNEDFAGVCHRKILPQS